MGRGGRSGMTAEVAIVGGGPAGAITAALLASAGREVVLLERAPAWRWRACGVFTSPAVRPALRGIGLSDADIASVARPIPAMRVETPAGVQVRLTYASGVSAGSAVSAVSPDGPAMGFDRRALDRRLIQLARSSGADVRKGVAVSSVSMVDGGPAWLTLAGGSEDEPGSLSARVVVGADGLRSVVARAARVGRASPLGRRVAITFHVADPRPDSAHDARMVVIEGGYVGVAPVPGGRMNVGIVLGSLWAGELRRDGARSVASRILTSLPASDGPAGSWEPLDSVEGVAPLGHRVIRRAGEQWLLVGDAAGFLDPFTGEGLHRAILSAELAAEVLQASLARKGFRDLHDYDRAMGSRFGTKDIVSQIVQAFLGRPALFEYAARRLRSRDRLRDTLGLVIGDMVPARRALDPRYLAALLAP
jgi:flavin-dependent dehydrogenase